MSLSPHSLGPELVAALCRELARLAAREEEAAATEAARIPYWAPCPPSVQGHRAAARALRSDVARLEVEARARFTDQQAC